jgi:enoyl-CoA hydratase/carnithine racemase
MHSRITKHANGILQWTMNHLPTRNAFGYKMVDDLNEVLKQEFSALVVNSDLPDVFCAGGHLKERLEMNKKQIIYFTNTLRELYNRIDCLHVPTIAVLNGQVLGGGCEFALSFDFRIAHPNTRICLPQVRIGSIPGLGGISKLLALTGEAKAKELILLSKTLDSNEALRYGLLTSISEKPLEDTLKLGDTLIKRLTSYKLAKRAILGENEKDCYIEAIDNSERVASLEMFAKKLKSK